MLHYLITVGVTAADALFDHAFDISADSVFFHHGCDVTAAAAAVLEWS